MTAMISLIEVALETYIPNLNLHIKKQRNSGRLRVFCTYFGFLSKQRTVLSHKFMFLKIFISEEYKHTCTCMVETTF